MLVWIDEIKGRERKSAHIVVTGNHCAKSLLSANAVESVVRVCSGLGSGVRGFGRCGLLVGLVELCIGV